MRYPRSYYSTHAWIRRWGNKTGFCQHCEEEFNTEWANISGQYKRELDDWIELCGSCHFFFDIESHIDLTPQDTIPPSILTRMKTYPWFKPI